MKRAVLVTVHYALSMRRAGFHWIADALRANGWHVTFVTVSFSQLSRLKADHRFQYGLDKRANRLERLGPDLDSYVWFTLFHPLNRLPKVAQVLGLPAFALYGRLPIPGLRACVEDADLIMFESSAGLMLEPRFRRWKDRARFVYRVSDDLRLLRAHPLVLKAQERALERFDLISAPSEYIRGRLAGHARPVVHLHGIDTASFDAQTPDPYDRSVECHAVFVGTSHLDADFVNIAARRFSTWQFHIVGPLEPISRHSNVVLHGELPFEATVPYIVHADVGLATRSYAPGAESLTDSLKVIQYTYARLPIVAPNFLQSSRSNVFTYRPGDVASIEAALRAARAMDRSTVDRAGIASWTDLARELAGPELWP